MKKIIVSLSIIAVVAAIAIGATTAFFSDTETSKGNTFTAGSLDLKVDSKCHYNGMDCVDGYWKEEAAGAFHQELGACACNWELKDLTAEKLFNFIDVKPGDKGENTISLHVYDNNAWACVNIIPTHNDDVSSTEPELKAGDVVNTDSIYDGELAQNMKFKIWADVGTNQPNNCGGVTPGDNKYNPECGDRLLTEGTGPIIPTTYALADSQHPNVFTGVTNEPLLGSHDYYLGVEWTIPTTVGNIIQTDKYMADISFYTEQHRHNPGFVCKSVTPGPNTLRLENETPVQGGPWTIINDNTYADLTWSDGDTFAYTLNGQGLAASTTYSLIYYADGWPGNNPGAFIGTHTTNGSGAIVGASGNPNLGMDLPHSSDGNYAVGAKIWLVLSSDYNSGASSTGPMTAWQPAKYLFEGNVYIHYNDTNN